MQILKASGWKSLRRSRMVRPFVLRSGSRFTSWSRFIHGYRYRSPSVASHRYISYVISFPDHDHHPFLAGICKIWYYKRRSAKSRAKAGLPQLCDVDDLPDPLYDPNYVHVLSDKEQLDLHKRRYHLALLLFPISHRQPRAKEIQGTADLVSTTWHRNPPREYPSTILSFAMLTALQAFPIK
jgi:hypothetical protein